MKPLAPILVVILLGTVSCAGTSTPWPATIGAERPGKSISPNRTTFPTGLVIQPPNPAVPSDKTRWSGFFRGWACAQRECDVKLAVLEVSASGAKVVQLFASKSVEQVANPPVLEATFVGDELQVVEMDGTKFNYRMRIGGGTIEVFRSTPRGLGWGVLERVPPGVS